MSPLLARLASLRLTFGAMIALAALVLLSHSGATRYDWIAVPLAVMAVNLAAALATHRKLRAQRPLALFHVALMSVCLLAGINVLLRFDGRVELAEGQAFSEHAMQVIERGAWHRDRLAGVAFEQGRVEVDFANGMTRQETRSLVTVSRPGSQALHAIQASDGKPIKTGGYRFSVTPNKGYALVLTWRDAHGALLTGALHLPSYPAFEWNQEGRWVTPAGERIALALRPARRAGAAWTLSSTHFRGEVRLQLGDRDVALVPGQWIAIRGGALRLEGVRLWIGYRVDAEPMLVWVLGAALIGLACLGWHVYGGLRQRTAQMPARAGITGNA